MRIALDSTPLIHAYGGIPRYVSELAVALAELRPDDEIHLLSDQPDLHIDARLRAKANIILEPPSAPRFGGKWWSLGLPWELRKRGVDVFHGTNFEVPYLPSVPSVLTLHDLSPWREPPIRPAGSERVRRRAPWLLKRARLVLTPSEAIRTEAAARFGLDASRVIAIPHGASGAPAGADPDAIDADLAELGVAKPFALYLGDASPRKNLETAITAWRHVRDRLPSLGLVLAGPSTERFRDSGDGPVALGPVAEQQAQSLLAAASVFVYPSYYEGFGLPIVEAMRAGAPVVVSRDPALVETAADAALAADAESIEDWTRAIFTVASNLDLAADLRRRGFERAACFSWRLTAERTREAYEKAIRRI